MKIKLEIPTSDFKRLINELNKSLEEGWDFTRRCARNQIVEEGGYAFTVKLDKGYCHDSGKFEDRAKVILSIDTTHPETID